MFSYGIDKDLNIFLSSPDQARTLILKYGLKTILGSKAEKFKNIKARKKVGFSYKKVCNIFNELFSYSGWSCV